MALPRRVVAAVPPAMTDAHPIARKSSALKMACAHRWNSPASGPSANGATARAESMTPTWLTVDHASRRLRSLWAKARTAASTIVTATEMPSTQRAGWLRTRTGKSPASTTVPAATIVAAWMSALAGVGPSMASASQSWKGTCADLPSTPMTMSVMATARAAPSAPSPDQASTTPVRLVVPAPAARPTMPRTNPMSATRVTRKAL